eukprot:TRINITY_DN19226_c0_g1_i4.p1 TRINITY_DN19226_c0_g1~~TRINITY_DN19226_c0_g1_i4.p1  ORF type:complete len:299 (-),score=49.51 TRINITY_DN19226_c0_g1_i4:99-884(-)
MRMCVDVRENTLCSAAVLAWRRHRTQYDAANHSARCDTDLAYALPPTAGEDCKTKVIPDFVYFAWPEVGWRDFTALVGSLEAAKQTDPQTQACGWIGNLATNEQRRSLKKAADALGGELVEVLEPKDPKDRMTLEQQVKRWKCLIDVAGRGYSGRLPALLHSGRPLLIVQRSNGKYLDPVWASLGRPEKLEPWKHFVPVSSDLSDLEARLRWLVSPEHSAEAQTIAGNAAAFAKSFLTYQSAVESLATTLTTLSAHGKAAP